MGKYQTHTKALLLGLLVLFLDQLSKALVFINIPLLGESSVHYPYGGIGVFKNFLGIEFSIDHATNKGAAWGVLAEFQLYLLALRIALILGMLIYLIFYNTRKNLEIPLAMIIAGALGNVMDYFFYGHVVDMFHLVFWEYDYPIFNVADAAIFVGIAWLCILSWCDKSSIKNSV